MVFGEVENHSPHCVFFLVASSAFAMPSVQTIVVPPTQLPYPEQSLGRRFCVVEMVYQSYSVLLADLGGLGEHWDPQCNRQRASDHIALFSLVSEWIVRKSTERVRTHLHLTRVCPDGTGDSRRNNSLKASKRLDILRLTSDTRLNASFRSGIRDRRKRVDESSPSHN